MIDINCDWIGINAGEPVTERNDFFGSAVQLAKRICDLASPDHILISDVVKGLCTGRSFQFEELEARNLKGFNQPIKTLLCMRIYPNKGILL